MSAILYIFIFLCYYIYIINLSHLNGNQFYQTYDFLKCNQSTKG